MKYMTFNSSCAYAGMANMLERCGVDVEDREIALDMGLPFLVAQEDGVYCAGPMLQTAKWFHLYLRPRGFLMTETRVAKEAAGRYLKSVSCGMLGIAVPSGGRHAVVYTGMEEGRYSFLNNKRRNSPEPEKLLLTETELAECLGDTVVIATIEKAPPQPRELAGYFRQSVEVLQQLKEEITVFCGKERNLQELAEAKDRLFRGILLDAVTMLELIGENGLGGKLQILQRQFTDILKKGTFGTLRDRIFTEAIGEAIDDYIQLIRAQIAREMQSAKRDSDTIS